MFHGCPPSPDAWGRLTSEPRFIIYRGTATFTPCSERGPLRHLEKMDYFRRERDQNENQNSIRIAWGT
jgi:hypothetical protein